MALPIAVASIVGAALVALVAVGAVVSASAQRLPTGPPVAPPAPSAIAGLNYDPSTRTASTGKLRATLAGDPYACAASPAAALPTFSMIEACSASVHEDYNSSGSDWAATTGLGLIAPSLVVPGDLEGTGDRVFRSLRGQFFADEEIDVRDLVAQNTDLAAPGTSIAISGDIHYAVKGVPSRFDRLLVVIFELENGNLGAWFSSRPDDAPKATLDALNASLATVTAS